MKIETNKTDLSATYLFSLIDHGRLFILVIGTLLRVVNPFLHFCRSKRQITDQNERR